MLKNLYLCSPKFEALLLASFGKFVRLGLCQATDIKWIE
jgi:hypothetical protein